MHPSSAVAFGVERPGVFGSGSSPYVPKNNQREFRNSATNRATGPQYSLPCSSGCQRRDLTVALLAPTSSTSQRHLKFRGLSSRDFLWLLMAGCAATDRAGREDYPACHLT